MASRKGINIYIPEYYMAVRNFFLFFSWVRGTFLLTCSYIGELRNSQKFKCENEPFIVLVLVLARVLS